MRAVGDDRLAFGQLHFLAGPENSIAHAVRNVDHPVSIEAHNAHFRDVEVRVVARCNGIVRDCILELLPALHASRDH